MERNKIFIFKTLHNLRDELANYLWDLDDNNKPLDRIKNEDRFHLCACMRYGFSYFTPETLHQGYKGSSRSYLPAGMY